MTPLKRAEPFAEKWRDFLARHRVQAKDRPDLNFSKEVIFDTFKHLRRSEFWLNDVYQVQVDKETEGNTSAMRVWHLSIKRLDKQPIHDWRDLQEIKNQICGSEVEALELYPAESRLMDVANQFHLWALPDGERIPFGYQTARAVTDKPAAGAVQRPRPKP